MRRAAGRFAGAWWEGSGTPPSAIKREGFISAASPKEPRTQIFLLLREECENKLKAPWLSTTANRGLL